MEFSKNYNYIGKRNKSNIDYSNRVGETKQEKMVHQKLKDALLKNDYNKPYAEYLDKTLIHLFTHTKEEIEAKDIDVAFTNSTKQIWMNSDLFFEPGTWDTPIKDKTFRDRCFRFAVSVVKHEILHNYLEHLLRWKEHMLEKTGKDEDWWEEFSQEWWDVYNISADMQMEDHLSDEERADLGGEWPLKELYDMENMCGYLLSTSGDPTLMSMYENGCSVGEVFDYMKEKISNEIKNSPLKDGPRISDIAKQPDPPKGPKKGPSKLDKDERMPKHKINQYKKMYGHFENGKFISDDGTIVIKKN